MFIIYSIMNSQSISETWETLEDILDEQNIIYSISPITYEFSKKHKNIDNLENFCLSIYYKDYMNLMSYYPTMFKDNEDNNYKDLAPYFVLKNHRIYFDLIVPTNENKIEEAYKFKNKKVLLYWGKGHSSLFIKLCAFKTKKPNIQELIKQFYEPTYLKFIVLSSRLKDFRVYDNLNYNDMKTTILNKKEFKYFSAFDNTQDNKKRD